MTSTVTVKVTGKVHRIVSGNRGTTPTQVGPSGDDGAEVGLIFTPLPGETLMISPESINNDDGSVTEAPSGTPVPPQPI